jgi:hypothetical protein
VTRASVHLLLWSPRVLGVAGAVFIGLFALDAFSPGKPFTESLPDFLVHLMPALALLGLVLVSWHRPWIGGVAFVALAVAYVVVARNHLDWIIVISGPLVVAGILFLSSWHYQRRRR